MRNRALLVATATTAAFPAAAFAQTTRTGLEVTGTAGYSNNPYAEAASNRGSAFVAVDVAPSVEVRGPRGDFSVTGLVHLQEYTKSYPTNDSYRLSADGRTRPTERLSLFAHLDLSSSVLGGDDQFELERLAAASGTTGIGLTPIAGPTGGDASVGGTSPTSGAAAGGFATPITTGPLIGDIGLLGSRDRVRSAYASVGGSDALSARDTVSLSGFADVARYSRFGSRSNYDGYGGTLGYSRQVSPYVRLGVQGTVSRYDYRSQSDVTVYSGQATASGRLNRFWTFDAALGASFIHASPTTALATPTTTDGHASLSGSLRLCEQRERDQLCVLASREARATGYNGAQYLTSAGLSYTRTLDERTRLLLDGSYVQEGGLTRLNGGQNQYVRASATVDRRLTQRLRGLVTARYRRVYGGNFGGADDYGGQLGLSYRFGTVG